MNALPTTTVTILGGTTTNPWGDPTEGEDVIRADVPIAIHEQNVKVLTESDPAQVINRVYTGRAPHWSKDLFTNARRIKDQRTDEIYLIDAVTRPQNAAVPQDVRLDLRRVE